MDDTDNLKVLFHSLILAQNTYIVHKNTKAFHTDSAACLECERLFCKYKQAKEYYMSAINLFLDGKPEATNGS